MLFKLKIAIAYLLVKLRWCTPVVIYYSCHEQQEYLTISIIRYPFGIGKLETGNSYKYAFSAWLKKCGFIKSETTLYAYAVLKSGWVLFDGTSGFGYDDKRKQKGKLINLISTSATFTGFGMPLNNNTPHYDAVRLLDKLNEFKLKPYYFQS